MSLCYRSKIVLLFLLLPAGPVCRLFAVDELNVSSYRGMSDASAAVMIDKDKFIAADDESNILRVYQVEGGFPVDSVDLTGFLAVEGEYPEVDIEGATKVRQRIYWISSHGRNKDGKMRVNRYRFFATEIKKTEHSIKIVPVGKPYVLLGRDIVGSKKMSGLGLSEATRFNSILMDKKAREKLAPKENGLNIEGLCASDDGKILYIGLRNPRLRGISEGKSRQRAIIIPLLNASDIIDKGKKAEFGDVILLDLGGLGIRSMEYSSYHETFFIVAGRHDNKQDFELYTWSGRDETVKLVLDLNLEKDFGTEALMPMESSSRLFLLSDDGTIPIKVNGPDECADSKYYMKEGLCENKYLRDENKKRFRGIIIEP